MVVRRLEICEAAVAMWMRSSRTEVTSQRGTQRVAVPYPAMPTRRALALALLSAAPGCSPSPTPSATAHGPPEGSPGASTSVAALVKNEPAGKYELRADLEGSSVTFRYGGAHASADGLRIILSDRPLPCGVTRMPRAHQLEIALPIGPGGGFFAGQAAGVSVSLYFDQRLLPAVGGEGVVRVSPFLLKSGEPIRGTVAFKATRYSSGAALSSAAHGAFEVTACDGPGAFRDHAALPTAAASTPLSGEFAGQKFEFKKGIARVRRDSNQDMDVLDEILLFATPNVSCAHAVDLKHGHFAIGYVGGANSRDRLTGAPQPARPAWRVAGESRALQWFGGTAGDRGAWVQFDSLDFSDGAIIRGSAVASSGHDAPPGQRGSFNGRFEAVVCRTPIADGAKP